MDSQKPKRKVKSVKDLAKKAAPSVTRKIAPTPHKANGAPGLHANAQNKSRLEDKIQEYTEVYGDILFWLHTQFSDHRKVILERLDALEAQIDQRADAADQSLANQTVDSDRRSNEEFQKLHEQLRPINMLIESQKDAYNLLAQAHRFKEEADERAKKAVAAAEELRGAQKELQSRIDRQQSQLKTALTVAGIGLALSLAAIVIAVALRLAAVR